MPIVVTPHFEWLQALADLEQGSAPGERASAWRARTRRRLDRALLRQLSSLAGRTELWDTLTALPIGDDMAVTLEQLDTHVALSGGERAALRRFDRLAFAPLWRSLLPDFEDAAAVAAAEDGAEAIVIPTAFLPRRLTRSGREIRLLPVERLGRRRATSGPETHPIPTPAADPAVVFQALGDATRYAIAGLIAREPLTSAELARRLGVATPTVTHHLHRLRAAGLVIEQRRGNSVLLSLDRRAIAAVSGMAVAHFFEAGGVIPLRRSRSPSRR